MKKNVIYRILSLYFKRRLKALKTIKNQSRAVEARANTNKSLAEKEQPLASNVKVEPLGTSGIEKNDKLHYSRTLFQKTKDITILLAEDNKDEQSLISSLIQKENYKIDSVKNGWEALCAFEAGQYDLILMDINMPIMNGDESTIAIRQLNSQIPIIALTNDISYDLFKDKLNLGFTDVISKPLDKELLVRTIRNLIALKANALRARTAFDSLTCAS
ncbi:response regulator [Algibacter mikhailovii]|uniref:Response regulatory domain-containing protein n=1 Tax=Algibacter mikhailovii TaxID=425498 RepID=A0A918R072_9FLAO|nr:response regulator [Algibacter mikhailovii]GGZ82029.1 hypothetical protein GCM10007028_19670 [Algibacter mikhailovii]